MTIKSTLALALVFSTIAVGGAAQEAPYTGPAKQFESVFKSSFFAGGFFRKPENPSGQATVAKKDDSAFIRTDGHRQTLFQRLSRFFKSDAPAVETRSVRHGKKVVRNERKSERRARISGQQAGERRFGYVFAPSLDDMRAAAFPGVRAPAKRERRLHKSNDRRNRISRQEKKRKIAAARRLSSAEETQLSLRLARVDSGQHRQTPLANRMGPDRGAGSRAVRMLASFRIQKPVTSDRKYGLIVARYARAYGVPVDLAHAVIKVESNYRVNARGRAGEIGLMQIKPATARMMGYSGSAKGLYAPETNIKYGMKYLGKAHKLGGGSTCGTILKYNAGHAARRMNPISARYCAKVKRHLRGA